MRHLNVGIPKAVFALTIIHRERCSSQVCLPGGSCALHQRQVESVCPTYPDLFLPIEFWPGRELLIMRHSWWFYNFNKNEILTIFFSVGG